MKLIQDPPADGPKNMQRDLELLESLGEELVLRIYQWTPNWISYGYFQTEANAQNHFPEAELNFVKRPTGGGLVDHRHDLTYTLLIPKTHLLAQLSRSECYCRVHQIIHRALLKSRVEAKLFSMETSRGIDCFQSPVPGDIIDPKTHEKLAGAAQRRTRKGLLHQGSIQCPELNKDYLIEEFKKIELCSQTEI